MSSRALLRHLRMAFVPLFAAASIGCGGEGLPGAGVAGDGLAAGTGTLGHVAVTVERAVGQDGKNGDGAAGEHIATSALFVRSRGMELDQTKTLLGISEPDGLEPGECRLYDRSAALDEAAASSGTDLQLLDAGTLIVVAGTHTFTIESGRYPDLLPSLSGFHYTDSRNIPADKQVADVLRVAGGGEEVLPFAGATRLPEPPHLLEVGHTAVDGQSTIEASRSAQLSVRVNASDAYVEIASGEPAMGNLVLCRPIDERSENGQNGRVDIPEAIMARLDAGRAKLSASRIATVTLQSGAAIPSAKLYAKGSETITLNIRD